MGAVEDSRRQWRSRAACGMSKSVSSTKTGVALLGGTLGGGCLSSRVGGGVVTLAQRLIAELRRIDTAKVDGRGQAWASKQPESAPCRLWQRWAGLIFTLQLQTRGVYDDLATIWGRGGQDG